MRRLSFVLFFLIGFEAFLLAGILSDADALFVKRDFYAAKLKYEILLRSKLQDAELNYKYGTCLFQLGELDSAIKPLTLASRKIAIANFVLGDLYYQKYNFEESIRFYNKAFLASDTSAIVSIQKAIGKAEKAQNMLQSVQEIQIIDSLVVSKKDFFNYYKLSNDAGEIFEVESDSLNNRLLTGFITEREDRVYFAQINGDNQSDLFAVSKLIDGWADKELLSPQINTTSNENFPFLMPDGVTLYFASDGENSIGGYDIFVSRYSRSNNDFLKPENIGMPFNSPSNDYLFAIDEETNIGYFATDRNQLSDKVIIYKFKPNATKILFESEDINEKIAVAQLKKYSLSLDETIEHSKESDNKKAKHEIFFVVTDNIVYTSIEQFESKEALTAYQTARMLESDNVERKRFIEQKRTEYILAKKDDKYKQELFREIHLLEQEMNAQDQSPEDYFKLARKLELEEKNKKSASEN